ncbi:hypothetical protein V8D89_001202 [Ganoderma adspersum]
MRLLDTETGQFVEKYPEKDRTVYATLSHTWDAKGEQTYQELKKIQGRYNLMSRIPIPQTCPVELPSKLLRHAIWHDCKLSPKVRHACRVARENGYRYIWIDSCCIDKSSSSELSEAINSMYKWYGLAAVCYAYLADVPPGEDHHAKGSAFRESRWFCRGWTLQELIAPLSVEFLSNDWAPIGSKHALADLVENVTKIEERALLHVKPLDTFSVAQRLSWAAYRETTRVEDRAYSLLGLFDINMPTLYGEGDRAFRRLQEQIMQHTPDQSLFAWGDIYLSSQLFQDPDLTNTPRAHRAILWAQGWRRHLFATSPNFFDGCEGVRTARREAGQLVSSNGHKIAYTPTPYGISTQFLMVPLTQDLLLRAIPHSAEDLQLDTSDLQKGSQLYLLILRCELGGHQGHCLGRVCYLTPSEESDVNFIYTGRIRVNSRQRILGYPDLFLLSPETIEQCRPQTELKTVYIPHPDRATLPTSSSLQRQPHTMIKLDEHTITVEFQHNLEDDGKWFTIDAEVKMSGSRVQLDSALDFDQVDHHTVSWSDCPPWETERDHKRVRLSAAGAGMLTVDLGLDFGGGGLYILRVDVLSDAPPASSAVERAVDQEEEGEGTGEGSPSGAIDNEEETAGGETAPSAGDRDVVAPSDNTEDGDGDGVPA